ncbi:MAG: threonine synthase [Candidatus Thermoplasmatota archaeon]|nr:threonine synthase [Candidatus Thermoplasmatota archaeon]
MDIRLKCMECGREYEEAYRCSCGGLLDVVYEGKRNVELKGKGVWRYSSFLPDFKKRISLQEGGTPLYKCDRLSERFGVDLYVKFEGANPTGSFKDRGMTVGISRAFELGKKRVVCASTGNTSASMAAYAAKAGMRALVILPKGKIAMGKLAQSIFYGAEVFEIDGNFDDAMFIVERYADEGYAYMLNSLNPFRPEGQKTIGFEIAEALKGIDRVFVPVGNAANIWAIYKGFKEFLEEGLMDSMPRMVGVQAKGAMPVVQAYESGIFRAFDNPETVATAIRIGNPVNAKKALTAIKESDGSAIAVSDEEILEAQRDLAVMEGIGVEPASAASFAGVKKLLAEGAIEKGERIVCVTTGHILKDPDSVMRVSVPPKSIKSYEELLEYEHQDQCGSPA